MSLTATAHRYLEAGLSILPASPVDKCPTLTHWKQYQQRLPTFAESDHWFAEANGMCVVTGEVSGNLEILDFDLAGELFPVWYQRLAEDNSALLDRLVVERSPSNGLHVAYRCESPVSGSLKLAQRRVVVPTGDPVEIAGKTYIPRREGNEYVVLLTLIETRGERSVCLCDPSPGYELQQGSFDQLPVLTSSERDLLLQTAWELTEYRPPPAPDPPLAGEPIGRPGDDYNARGDLHDLLQRHGWQLVRSGANAYWRRPGKPTGWSATLKDRVFYVFSSNAAPFEPERAYSPFGVYALLEHAGDFEEAARTLRQLGYGSPPPESDGVDLSGILGRRDQTTASRPAPETRLIARRVSEVRRTALEWLWPGRIPLGKLTLLAGDPGLGKSMVSIDIAARISRGGCWPDNSLARQPVGTVIMFNAEDDLEDTIAPRLDAAQGDDQRVIVVEGVEARSDKAPIQRSFSLEADLPRLEAMLEEQPETRLVVIDPISAYCGRVDTHNNAEVRAMLAPLAQLASSHRVAVLAITHLTKGSGNKAVYRAIGSLAFAAAARAVWAIVGDTDDRQRRLFLPAKLNLAQFPDGLAYRVKEHAIGWEADPVPLHADDAFAKEAAALDQRGRSPRQTLKQQAREWLAATLTEVGRPSAEVLEEGDQYGLDRRTLQRAFKELGGVPHKTGFDGGWVWSLPRPQELPKATTSF